MKHTIKITFVCIMVLLVLSGCGKKNETFEVINQDNPQAQTQTVENTVEPVVLTPEIDPLAEEELGDPIDYFDETEPPNLNADVFNAEDNVNPVYITDVTQYPYVGSTPIAILPVDLPTPTPRQALEFTYQTYEASRLNLKFEAPSGWEPDESIQDTYILNEPAANQKDGYSASITIRAIAVAKDYTESDLRREINQQLEQLGATNYSEWRPSLLDTRELLGKNGVYANYSGTLVTGIRVRGRIHVTCINKVLYTVHFSQPANFNNDYIAAYTQLRKTIDFINK